MITGTQYRGFTPRWPVVRTVSFAEFTRSDGLPNPIVRNAMPSSVHPQALGVLHRALDADTPADDQSPALGGITVGRADRADGRRTLRGGGWHGLGVITAGAL